MAPSPSIISAPSFTVYAKAERNLKKLYASASVDFEAFARPILRCDLHQCKSMCCHNGVYLTPDEVGDLRQIVKQHYQKLESFGIRLPRDIVTPERFPDGIDVPKTTLKPKLFSKIVDNYPSDLTDTACCFLLEDGRCSLEATSIQAGKGPHYYRPLACSLYPIIIRETPDLSHPVRLSQDTPPMESVITLIDERSDPLTTEDSVGPAKFHRCALAVQHGRPAYQVLADEISLLGKILGRPLLEEIQRKLE